MTVIERDAEKLANELRFYAGRYHDHELVDQRYSHAARLLDDLASQLRGAVVVDDAAIERAADALAAKLHWLRDFDRARELARAALHAAAGGNSDGS